MPDQGSVYNLDIGRSPPISRFVTTVGLRWRSPCLTIKDGTSWSELSWQSMQAAREDPNSWCYTSGGGVNTACHCQVVPSKERANKCKLVYIAKDFMAEGRT